MKWVNGLTKERRLEFWNERISAKAEKRKKWARWFAWRPVTVGMTSDQHKIKIWLQYVERSADLWKAPWDEVFTNHPEITWHWYYREIPTPVKPSIFPGPGFAGGGGMDFGGPSEIDEEIERLKNSENKPTDPQVTHKLDIYAPYGNACLIKPVNTKEWDRKDWNHPRWAYVTCPECLKLRRKKVK